MKIILNYKGFKKEVKIDFESYEWRMFNKGFYDRGFVTNGYPNHYRTKIGRELWIFTKQRGNEYYIKEIKREFKSFRQINEDEKNEE